MKRRILSLLLCVCMLASTAVLFSSCGKKTLDFANGYTVVYGEGVSQSISKEINALAKALTDKTGTDVATKKVKSDAELDGEADYEILVGYTNRPETERVLKKIKGQGYAIKTVGKKLVIVGTTNLLTSVALDYFVKTYVSGADSISTIDFKKVENYNMEMVEISTKTSFVYSNRLVGEGDYVIDAIQRVKTVLSDKSSVRGTGMNAINDTLSAKAEILMGVVNREETKALLSSMDSENYAVAVRNGKIIVTAFNDTVLSNAVELFGAMIGDAVYYNEEEDTKQVLFPADFTRIYTEDTDFVVDFPRPEGLTLTGTIDVYNNNLLYNYDGESVNPDAYEKYCKKLVSEGYSIYTDHNAEGNIFRTYINKTTNISLYVAYYAFQHAAKQNVDDREKCIHVIASTIEDANLIPEKMLTQDLSFTHLQNSAVTSVHLDYSDEDSGAGQLEIMTLEDGSFIIIDGGNKRDADVTRIWNILVDLYKQGHSDMMPTPKNPIRVVAWYNTHGHGDHIGSTLQFINKYCKNYTQYPVTIDYLIANYPSDEGYYNCYRDKNSNSSIRDNMKEYSAMIQDAPGETAGMQFIRVRTGQKFYIANVEFEVMFTPEDFYPARTNTYNDTCTVIRTLMHHTKDGAITEGSSTSVMWLGDAYPTSASYMRAMYGSYLKSDVVQMSHHGTGADWNIYGLIAAKCAIIPAKRVSYLSALGKTSSLMYKITFSSKTVEYIIVADLCNYTLVLTQTGFNYTVGGRTGVYNAGERDIKAVELVKATATATSGYLYTNNKK